MGFIDIILLYLFFVCHFDFKLNNIQLWNEFEGNFQERITMKRLLTRPKCYLPILVS